MTDIVERLRNGWIEELSDYELCQAADEIERLRDEVGRFRRALNAISCQDADYKDEGVIWCASRARNALGEGKE